MIFYCSNVKSCHLLSIDHRKGGGYGIEGKTFWMLWGEPCRPECWKISPTRRFHCMQVAGKYRKHICVENIVGSDCWDSYPSMTAKGRNRQIPSPLDGGYL